MQLRLVSAPDVLPASAIAVGRFSFVLVSWQDHRRISSLLRAAFCAISPERTLLALRLHFILLAPVSSISIAVHGPSTLFSCIGRVPGYSRRWTGPTRTEPARGKASKTHTCRKFVVSHLFFGVIALLRTTNGFQWVIFQQTPTPPPLLVHISTQTNINQDA